MAGRIQNRRDTAANWTSANPILAAGEKGIETDTGREKNGNGVDTWTARPYVDDAGIATRVPNAALSTDGQILTRVAGTPTGVTRDVVAADNAFAKRYGQTVAQRAAVARMATSEPSVWTVLGDSTSAPGWLTSFTTSVVTANPTRTVQTRSFRNGTKDYGPATYNQIGTAGLGYLTPGAGGIGTPDAAAKSLTSVDALFYSRVRFNALTAAQEQTIAGHWGSSGQFSWWWYLTPAGAMAFAYSANGTASVVATLATAPQVAAAITAGTDAYIGLLFVRDNAGNSLVQAQVSTDGTTWNVLGASVTSGATLASLHDSTADVTLGCLYTSSYPMNGRIYWLECWKGTGTSFAPAFRFDASLWSNGSSFVDAEANTWTLRGAGALTAGAPLLLILNGSVAGWEITTATTNIATVCKASGTNLAIVNYGHNQEATVAAFKTFVDLVKTNLPETAIIVTRQNPTGSTSATKDRQNRQMARLAELAAREGYSVIDAYSAFVADSRGDALMTSASDVHPNSTGYSLWGATAAASFGY